jgi:hypothetical protein
MAQFLPTFEKCESNKETLATVGDLEEKDLADGLDNKY